jgi:hypothetical protein
VAIVFLVCNENLNTFLIRLRKLLGCIRGSEGSKGIC